MNIVVIGAQWGDEGKGKMVDFLSVDADVVVRFSGGANAGHTIVSNNKTYKLHLVPSGILYEDTRVILGSGMVIDPESLFSELRTLEAQGIQWKGRVFISNRAHIVLPRYKEMDEQRDRERTRPIGTTGRGIGVAYSLKASRDGLRLADIFDTDQLNILTEEERKYLAGFTEAFKEMMIEVTEFLHEKKPERMLLEGAQGALLDLDIGTYPYVSSGYSAAAGASLGAGIGPRQLHGILGVFKAYSTRVGNGPFPSEFNKERDGDMEELVRELGHEYGVTTGRPRRCGYLDLVALRYTCRANSLDGLILTHIDVYDRFDDVYACVAYEIDGRKVSSFPAGIADLEQAIPVLQRFPGWKQDITGTGRYEDLPEAAREYIAFIEDFTDTRVTMVSVGPERRQTIIRQEPWAEY